MLRELSLALQKLYPHTPRPHLEQACLLVMRGAVHHSPEGYLVTTDEDDWPEEGSTAHLSTLVVADEQGLHCTCGLPAPRPESTASACLHLLAVSAQHLEAELTSERPVSPVGAPEHSITLSGFTPHGYNLLACARGHNFAALLTEMLALDAAWVTQGIHPDARFHPQAVAQELPAQPQAAAEAPRGAGVQETTTPVVPPAPPVQAPQMPPGVQPAAPVQAPTSGPRAGTVPSRGRGRPAPSPDGSFRAATLSAGQSRSGTWYWKVFGPGMPQARAKSGIPIWEEALVASGLEPTSLDTSQTYTLTGRMAWYVNGPDGIPAKVVLLEEVAA